MDISDLESIVRNHPIVSIMSVAVGVYLAYSSVCLALIPGERKRIRKLRGEIISYRSFIEQHLFLLEDSQIRDWYANTAQITE